MAERVTDFDQLMTVVDKRLTQLKMSRTATSGLPGVRSSSVNDYFAGRTKTIATNIVFSLLAGLGIEVWLVLQPRTKSERAKYELEMTKFVETTGAVRLRGDE